MKPKEMEKYILKMRNEWDEERFKKSIAAYMEVYGNDEVILLKEAFFLEQIANVLRERVVEINKRDEAEYHQQQEEF